MLTFISNCIIFTSIYMTGKRFVLQNDKAALTAEQKRDAKKYFVVTTMLLAIDKLFGFIFRIVPFYTVAKTLLFLSLSANRCNVSKFCYTLYLIPFIKIVNMYSEKAFKIIIAKKEEIILKHKVYLRKAEEAAKKRREGENRKTTFIMQKSGETHEEVKQEQFTGGEKWIEVTKSSSNEEESEIERKTKETLVAATLLEKVVESDKQSESSE